METRKEATLESLPTDVLGYIVSLTQNAASMFYVNKRIRAGVQNFIKSHPANFLTLKSGEVCYIVYDHVTQEVIDRLLIPHDAVGGEIARFKEIRREFNDDDMQKVRNKFYAPSCCKLGTIVHFSQMRENIVYIEKSENGIKYSYLSIKNELNQGSVEFEWVKDNKIVTGEINFQQLPLLECLAKKSFALSDYKPLYDRIIAIMFARKHIDLYRMVPIFKDESEAVEYAKSKARSLHEQCPVVHECEVKHNLVISRQPKEITPGQTQMIAYVHKSDVTLTGASCPVNTQGAIEITSGKKKCLVM